eukprot:2061379-Alexandrium_andersonii.AAC.1
MCIRDSLDPRLAWGIRTLREQLRRIHFSGASRNNVEAVPSRSWARAVQAPKGWSDFAFCAWRTAD